MKKVLLVLMMLMVIPSVGNAQRLKWEKGYLVDEFNDPDPNMPFYALTLPGDGADLRLRVSRFGGIEFIHDYYPCYYDLKFKLANGKIVEIPVTSVSEYVTQVDESYVWTVVDIMARGNYTISLTAYSVANDSEWIKYVARVKQQTQSIKQILNKLGVDY